MQHYLKTPGASAFLGVPCTRLYSLIRSRKIDPPGKDSSGDYVWTARDLDAVRKHLCLAPGPARDGASVPRLACDGPGGPAGEGLAGRVPLAPDD